MQHRGNFQAKSMASVCEARRRVYDGMQQTWIMMQCNAMCRGDQLIEIKGPM